VTPPIEPTTLTPLQREIVFLVMDGLTNREIADRLVLTPGQVGMQIGRIVHKLGLTSRSALVQSGNWS
jgi:DNA-binding CsgD family transcriptional regulator